MHLSEHDHHRPDQSRTSPACVFLSCLDFQRAPRLQWQSVVACCLWPVLMLNHSCATSVSVFCEVRYPAKHLFRPARAGSSTVHFAIAPLKLGACASQAEATLSFSRQVLSACDFSRVLPCEVRDTWAFAARCYNTFTLRSICRHR